MPAVPPADRTNPWSLLDSNRRWIAGVGSSVVHRHLRRAALDRDRGDRGRHEGPPPAVRVGGPPPTLRSGAAPRASARLQDRDRLTGRQGPVDPLERAHGKRLNQWAARPAPPRTSSNAAAANHWVTSRCSVVYPIREPRLW